MLRKSLGPMQVQLISLGGVIGSAYFLGVGAIIAENGATSVLAFLLGGLIVWLVCMAMGELCVEMPREGGFVSHSRELIGRPWAASVGWSYWFNWCAYIPSEMIAAGIICHDLFPDVPVIGFAFCFAALITVINLLSVSHFAWVESTLALIKIGAILVFCAVAGWILLVGGADVTPLVLAPAIPASQGSLAHLGWFGFLVTMVLVLVNFQGTELIVLSAAETRDSENAIPKVVRRVGIRIVGLFVLPVALLVLLLPGTQAGVNVGTEHSVFAQVLHSYGFHQLASLFKLVVVVAALSCANSGLYGASRSLYGLGKEGLAPRWAARLNVQGVPALATALTIAVSWSFLPLVLFFEGSVFYTWLLGVSGFTGALCWLSISWCQIRLRQRRLGVGTSGFKSPETLDARSTYLMPGFPYLSWTAVLLQVVCLGLVAFHPTLRTSLVLGLPVFVVPGVVLWIKDQLALARLTGQPRLGHRGAPVLLDESSSV